MGAIKKSKSNSIYTQLVDGKICEYVGTEKKADTNICINEKFYDVFAEICGNLTYIGINQVDSSKGDWKELQLRLSEAGEPDVMFKCYFPSRESTMLLNRLATYLSEDRESYYFKMKSFKNEDGKSIVLLYDDKGELIPYTWTKENSNGLPAMEQKKDKRGNISYNSDSQTEYLEEFTDTAQKQIRDKYVSNSNTIADVK